MIHRRTHDVLEKALKGKVDTVLSLRLSDEQVVLYKQVSAYMECLFSF